MADEADRSLDTVGAFLRVWAQHPFDLPSRAAKDVARELEAWATHLLLGQPRPGGKPEEAPRGKLAQRDWQGVRQYIASLRAEEAMFVRQAVSDFRQAVTGLVSRVREAISEERVLDSRLAAQMEKLKDAIAGGDLRSLRAAAENAAEAVSQVLDAHRIRQAAQESEMSSRLAEMGERLQTAVQQAEEDALTGLVNRRGFDNELTKAAGIGGQFRVSSSLLLMDLDHFKKINDTFGHPAGDAALRAVGKVLTRTFPRRSDCVARYGGEEFAIILHDARQGEAQRLATRFLESLRALRIEHDAHRFHITASVGVAELGPDESAEAFLARADAAVYAAKAKGRDCVVVA